MDFHSALRLIHINLKRNFQPHFCLALLITLLTPVVFGISSLDERLTAQPVEMMLSLTGIILLTPVFMPEQNENIRDVIRSKKTDYIYVCIIRVIYSVLALALIIGGFVFVMRMCKSDVTYRHFAGGFASALFLGTLGFAGAGITNNIPVGYMTSLIYYIANFTLKDKLGKLFLFSMCTGSFEEKYYIIAFSLIIIISTFIIIKKVKII